MGKPLITDLIIEKSCYPLMSNKASLGGKSTPLFLLIFEPFAINMTAIRTTTPGHPRIYGV